MGHHPWRSDKPQMSSEKLTYTPLRVSAIVMAGATLVSIIIMAALLLWGDQAKEVDLVLATGIVGAASIFGGAIMQLITPEPKDPPNAHQAQLDHDAEMARHRLEEERIELERHRLAAQSAVTNVPDAKDKSDSDPRSP